MTEQPRIDAGQTVTQKGLYTTAFVMTGVIALIVSLIEYTGQRTLKHTFDKQMQKIETRSAFNRIIYTHQIEIFTNGLIVSTSLKENIQRAAQTGRTDNLWRSISELNSWLAVNQLLLSEETITIAGKLWEASVMFLRTSNSDDARHHARDAQRHADQLARQLRTEAMNPVTYLEDR